jgi:Cytochrome P460
MKKTVFSASVMAILALVLLTWSNGSLLAQDKYALKAPNGISFSEISGYETWQVIAPSRRIDNNELRIILGNPAMIYAYQEGIPGNGKPFPDGAIVVKIGWSERKSPDFPAAFEPDVLKRVEFIMKDSKKFTDTNGWGYARFIFDAKTSTFTPYGKDATVARECHQCHTIVKAKDFIFTGYPQR